MIQRVQSVYLLLITILMSFLILRPFAAITDINSQEFIFHAHAIKGISMGEELTIRSTIPIIGGILSVGLLSFITIFLYSKRIVQLRLIILNIIIIIALIGIMLAYYISVLKSVQSIEHAFRIPAIYPLMAIFLNFMAYRAINHDETLVNSYNRIR